MALIAWYPLDGNTEDYTVSQNHGVNNDVTWVNGKIGQAGSFNGTNSFVDIANKAELNPGNKNFSISLWLFIPQKGSSYRGIFTKNYTQAFGVFDVTSGFDSVGLYIRSGANANMINFTDSYGKWTHCVWTVSNSDNIQKSYKNGVFQNQTNHTVGNVTSTNNINIGRYSYNGTGYFSGQVNDARLFDHILSQKEINDLAKAKVLHYTFNKDEPIIYDGTGYKRNGVKNNSPVWSTDSALGGGAYSFNQSSISASSLNIPIKEFTITFFAKLTEYSYMTIGAPNNQSFEFKWRIVGQNPYWNSYWDGGSTTGMSYGFTPPLNEWHMYTLSHNGTVFKWYYDGQLISSRTITSGTFFNINTINTSGTSGEYLRGSMDDMILYTTMLSDENILDLYQTRSKIDNQGNLYANDFTEDYNLQTGLTLKNIFNDNNLLNFNFTWNEIGGAGYPGNFSLINNGILYNFFSGDYGMYITNEITVNTNTNYYVGADESIQSGILSLYGARVHLIDTNTWVDSNNTWRRVVNTGANTRIRLYFYVGLPINNSGSLTLRNPFIVNLQQFSSEPSLSQLDSWYKDFIVSRPKSSGIIKTRDFFEKKALDHIFIDNQLLLNPNFDNGTTNWTFNSRTSIVNGRARFLSGANEDAYILQNVSSITAGDILYVRFDLDVTTGTLLVNNDQTLPFNTTGTHSCLFTATHARLLLDDLSSQAADFYIDNVKLYNLTKLNLSTSSKIEMDQLFNSYEQNEALKIFNNKIIIRNSLYEGG